MSISIPIVPDSGGFDLSKIFNIGYNHGNGVNTREGTLRGLTQKETHHTETKRTTDPIDLTAKELKNIGLDSPVALLQRGVVRLRVELNGESIGAGSGIVISSDGLILSVNHVPALGKQAGVKPFDVFSGTSVLKSLKSWHELLGEKGEARLVADFPLLPKKETQGQSLLEGLHDSFSGPTPFLKKIFESKSATAFSRYEDTIEHLTVPIEILAESPSEDLMLARICLPETQDPYPFVKVTNIVPSKGDFVYSIGHPCAIKHNALALGEVLDGSFDVAKIKKAIEAHGVILGGVASIFSGNGIKDRSFISGLAKALSTQFAGIDVEPLVKFLNGAVVSTNRIDHGSSGGLLCNESGEAVGITYLGMLLSFNNTPFLKYSAGVLDFHPRELPLSAVTGSVGMKKAIPFLESHGVNITRIRDGEPAGIEIIEEGAKKNKAREALITLWQAQKLSDAEIEGRLEVLDLSGK